MLCVPFVLGVCVAGKLNVGVLILLIASTALFISRESLLVWWRARIRGRADHGTARVLLAYIAITLVAGSVLILFYQLYWLLALGATGGVLLMLNAKQATLLNDRSIVSETLAIAGLTMTAPAAHYVATGSLSVVAMLLWALSAAYFASSVFYIKLRVSALHARKKADRQRARWQCIGYHSFLVLSLLACAITSSLSLFILIAFAPVLARTAWSLIKPANRLSLKRIGMAEIAYSIVFLVFIVLTFRTDL